MNYRDNYIKNIKFLSPEYIPVDVHVSMASRDLFRGDMESVMARYPEFFPGFEKGKIDYDNYDYGPANTKGVDFKDSWCCTWRTCFNGIEGVVIDSPIKTLDDYKTYRIPDPLTQDDRYVRNWEQEKKNIEELKKNEQLTFGGLHHGFTFSKIAIYKRF